MDDWFNKHENNDKNKDDRKIGRIFHDEESYSSFDFETGESSASEENSRGSDFTEHRINLESILESNNPQHSPSENHKKDNERDSVMAKNNNSGRPAFNEGMEFEDISSSKVRKVRKKGASKGKKIFLSIISILLVVVMVFVGYVYNILGSLDYVAETHTENEYISSADLYKSDDVMNILILGTDERASQANYRSDTMMMVSIDKKHKALKLTSFLRDSWVYIPARKHYAKLNAACSYGGAQMVIDTIEYNYKVDIDNYVMIDFDIFKTVINGIGGIVLDITEAEAANITKEGGFKCKPGKRRVKGRTALWYARIRHLDSDFNRTARQRKVISAVIDQLKTCGLPTILSVLESVLPEIQTDINKNELMSLGVKALMSYIKYDIVEQQIPAKGTWWNATISGQAVLQLDLDENIEILKEFIYDKSVEDIKEKSEQK